MTYPATNSKEASELLIDVSNQMHEIVNEDATTEVLTESGNVPSVRKALADTFLFQDPIAWNQGSDETAFNQLRTFDGNIYWAPTATTLNPIPMGATPIGDSNWKLAPVDSNRDSYIFKSSNTVQSSTTETTRFIEVCNNYAEVIIDGVELWLGDGEVSNGSKVSKIKIKNGGVLRLDERQFIFNMDNKSLLIDMREGGTLHCGLRKAQLASDTPSGANSFDVVDASDLVVGQTLSTSLAFDPANGGVNVWANAIRKVGDAFNQITDITGNTVTVQNPVPSTNLPQNTWLGSAEFGKNGLWFKGTNKKSSVCLLGGEVIEAGGGYYLSYTADENNTESIMLSTSGTKFKGQFLDAFLIRGGNINVFMTDNSDCLKSYDIAKQLFVFDSNGKYVHENSKIARGAYDAEYCTFERTDVGSILYDNMVVDGAITFDLQPDQIETISGQPLSVIWSQIGDALNVVEWNSKSVAQDYSTKGFKAVNSKFLNYRRNVLGTTYVQQTQNLSVNGDIEFVNCHSDCPPYHFDIDAGKLLSFNGSFRLVNHSSKIKYGDPYYVAGFIDDTLAEGSLPEYLGTTRIEITDQIQSPNNMKLYSCETLHIVGDSSVVLPSVKYQSPYLVDRIIAENARVNKATTGQSQGIVETIPIGANAEFFGQPWISRVSPQFQDLGQLFVANTSYSGITTTDLQLTNGTWLEICNLEGRASNFVAARVSLSPARYFGGSSLLGGDFSVSLLESDGETVASLGNPSAVNDMSGGTSSVLAFNVIDINGAISTVGDISFKYESGTLYIKVITSSPEIGCHCVVSGNVS